MNSILGQNSAVDVLLSQASAKRTHHAYIFHGPDGVGKFTTAAAFAQLLLCHHPGQGLAGVLEPCGQCESCRFFMADASGHRQAAKEKQSAGAAEDFSHPDLHVITKELATVSSDPEVRKKKQSNIPLDVLREFAVGGTSSGKSYSAPAYQAAQLKNGKVFIIDEAHLMANQGQNAMLKTLEEPPQGTVFILITANEDGLLPTIRSRCQRICFLPLADEIVTQWIATSAAQLSEEQRNWLVYFANGSLGRAALILKNDLIHWHDSILPLLDQMALGKPSPLLGAVMEEKIKSFSQAHIAKKPNASKLASNRLAANLMWSLVSGYARQKIYELSASCSADDPDLAQSVLNPWLEVIDAVKNTQRMIGANVHLSLVCDELSTTMHRHLA